MSQERDSLRHISLQKDIELKELQGRLDKAVRILISTVPSSSGVEILHILGTRAVQDPRDPRWRPNQQGPSRGTRRGVDEAAARQRREACCVRTSVHCR